jgi:dipeptidyl aminopeptidase/acylaminoacyl peptidase
MASGPDPATAATLQVRSAPPGATVEIGGRDYGRAPLDLRLAPGEHDLRLRLSGFVDAAARVALRAEEIRPLPVELWRAAPRVARVRPTFPGAAIVDAAFLGDGSLALTLGVGGRDERQLWLLSPGGRARRVGPSAAPGSIAVSPDGRRVAFLAPEPRADGPVGAVPPMAGRPLREVWIAGPTGEPSERLYGLGSATGDERLQEVRWAPDGGHVLLVVRQAHAGGAPRTRLLWVDAGRPGGGGEGHPLELVDLPSEVVAGSYVWSPDGRRVAFLARAGHLLSLCVVETGGSAAGDGFRYVADLGPVPAASQPLPWAPSVAWSPDGRRIAYAAPHRDGPAAAGGLLAGALGAPQRSGRGALYVADLSRPPGQTPDRLLLAAPDGAPLWPVWRPDGTLVVLTRAASNGAHVFALAAAAPAASAPAPFRPAPLDRPALPAKAAAFAALWDGTHAQVLVAVARPGRTGASIGAAAPPEFWLLRFGAADAPAEGEGR